MCKQRGFTLIETLIVVSVVGILASLAYASYSNSLEKSRRSDAKRALLHAAGLQERWYIKENIYTPNISEIGGAESPEGYYNLSSENRLPSGNCDDQLCFTITALVDAGGPQTSDSECYRFTIDSLGRKRAYTQGDVENEQCW